MKLAAERLSGKGLDAIAMEADVTNVKSVSELVHEIMTRYGRIDILVNNAAISAELRPAPFEQSSPEEWRRIYESQCHWRFQHVQGRFTSYAGGQDRAASSM